MKNIKKFESFTNEEVSKQKKLIYSYANTFQNPNGKTTHTFGAEEHLDFCKTVSEWIENNETPVAWCLYGKPNMTGQSFGLGIKQAETFWKQYVNGNKRFTLIEMDGKLIGVLQENGKVLMAFDEADVKVEPSVLSGLDF